MTFSSTFEVLKHVADVPADMHAPWHILEAESEQANISPLRELVVEPAFPFTDLESRGQTLAYATGCGLVATGHAAHCSPACAASAHHLPDFERKEWPQQVPENDTGGRPPPRKQVQGNAGKLTWYDWIADSSAMEDLPTNGWAENTPLAARHIVRIALAGQSKSGKTWLLHQLAGLQLEAIDNQGKATEVLCTPGLCCKHLNLDQKACQFIDSKAQQRPLCDVSSACEHTENSLLHNSLCDIADVLVYVVNRVSYTEQWMLMNLVEKQKAQNFQFTIIMVHNLSHIFRREDFEKAKHEIRDQYAVQGMFLKQFRDVDVLVEPSPPNHANPMRIHVFLAQQCHELSRDNEQTIRFLRKNISRQSFLRGKLDRSDRRGELHSSLPKAISQGGLIASDSEANKLVGSPCFASCRVVETQSGSVRIEMDSPGYSKEQMDLDLDKYGTRMFLNVAEMKSSAGVEITVNPLMPGTAGIAIVKQISFSSLNADYRDGTMLFTFLPDRRTQQETKQAFEHQSILAGAVKMPSQQEADEAHTEHDQIQQNGDSSREQDAEDGSDGLPNTLQPEQKLEPVVKTEQREYVKDADMSRQESCGVGEKEEPTCRQCACGCGFMVTWHATYCCHACPTGKHGPRCDRKPYVKECASGCGSIDTRHDTHCCSSCLTRGKHGPRCDRRILAKDNDAYCCFTCPTRGKHGPRCDPKPDVKKCASGCGFMVTWHDTHCCLGCLKQGKHGPRCDRRISAKENGELHKSIKG